MSPRHKPDFRDQRTKEPIVEQIWWWSERIPPPYFDWSKWPRKHDLRGQGNRNFSPLTQKNRIRPLSIKKECPKLHGFASVGNLRAI